MRFLRLLRLLVIFTALPVHADVALPDAPLPDLALTRVSERVYSAIGATAAPSLANLGHNNNLSFIVTDDGVVVINGGDNAYLAAALHQAIRSVTDQPVRRVISENGQGHAFLGNAYWDALGIPTFAHRDAVEEIARHGERSLKGMQSRMGDLATGTYVVLPSALDDREDISLGGTRIEVIRFGPAHSPGDISVWLPDESVLIAGDIAFHQRLLGIFPDTDVDGWIESFDELLALNPAIVVPGHGAPTTVEPLQRYTQDYLAYLRDEVARILEEGGDLNDAYDIDQSDYSDLDTFDELALKNAGRLYRMMELDFF